MIVVWHSTHLAVSTETYTLTFPSDRSFVRVDNAPGTRLLAAYHGGHGFRLSLNYDGHITVRDVLDADLIVEVRTHIDWLREHHPALRPEQLHDRQGA